MGHGQKNTKSRLKLFPKFFKKQILKLLNFFKMDDCQSIMDFFESWHLNTIAYVLSYFANECPKKSLWRVSKSNI